MYGIGLTLGAQYRLTCAHGDVQRELRHVSRDALAGMLGLIGERGTRTEGVRVLDIRRHDERSLYGSIPGAAQTPKPLRYWPC